jgi:hypothetical protein
LYSADTLLRAHLSTDVLTTGDEDEDLVLCVHTVTSNLPVSDKKLAGLREETSKDSTMIKLSEVIQEGWPNNKNKVSKQVSEYWAYRDELVEFDGLIFKGDVIVVPQTLRKDILKFIKDISGSKEASFELAS